MSRLLLCSVLVSIAVPTAAFAQCTKDTECKGDRICVNGVCVFEDEARNTPPNPPPMPTETVPHTRADDENVTSDDAGPAAPATITPEHEGNSETARKPAGIPPRRTADPGAESPVAPRPTKQRESPRWEVESSERPPGVVREGNPSRTLVLTTDPLKVLFAAMSGAANNLSVVFIPLELDVVISSYASLGGGVGAGAISGLGGSAALFAFGAGLRVHPLATSPAGLWIGAQGNLALILGSAGAVAAPDVLAGAGYTWLFDSGFTIGLGMGLSAAAIVNGSFPVELILPLGVAF